MAIVACPVCSGPAPAAASHSPSPATRPVEASRTVKCNFAARRVEAGFTHACTVTHFFSMSGTAWTRAMCGDPLRINSTESKIPGMNFVFS